MAAGGRGRRAAQGGDDGQGRLARRGQLACTTIVRNKDQYRLYFTDGYNFRVFARWGATGIGIYAFGSWVLSERRGWLPAGQAAQWAEQALRFLEAQTPRRAGLLPHFVVIRTGAAASESEYSTIRGTHGPW